MTLTILIPTRNRPNWLRFSLASLLRQDYRGGMEILVLAEANDSIQANMAVVGESQRQSSVPIRLYCLAPMTLAAKLDHGVRILARGNIIMQADDDDYHAPARASTQLSMIAAGADVCHIPAPYWSDIKTREIYQLTANRHPAGMVQGSTFCYRKEIFLKADGYPKECGTTHDKALALRLLEQKAKIIPYAGDPLQVAFEHGENYWSQHRDFKQAIYQRCSLSLEQLIPADLLALLPAR